jgi:poly(A) polymerase
VILVKHGRSTIEVATFRSEGVYEDGRRPSEVRFTSAEEDARRRDFTINGLFLDPIDGHVIDYVGGQADIAARVIRAIGRPAERFDEDQLRLLRAVRFAARFGFEIEPETRQAIVRLAPRLPRISPERIADELRRMLTPPSRDRAMDLLEELGLSDQVFRHLSLDPRTAGRDGCPPVRAGMVREPVEGGGPPSASDAPRLNPAPGRSISFALGLVTAILRWLALRGADPRSILDPPHVKAVLRVARKNLRISNDEARAIEGILDLSHLLGPDKPRVARLKRFLARPTSADAHALLHSLAEWGIQPDRIAWLEAQFQRLARDEVAPPPLLSGDDLVAAGYVPGPAFKRVLEETYDAQLESRVTDRAQAMALARSLLEALGGASPGDVSA